MMRPESLEVNRDKMEYFDICGSGRLDKMIAHCPMCMPLNRSVHNLVANGHTAHASNTDVSSMGERASICKSRNTIEALEIRAVPIYRT
jgi:hypothetical protein